MQMAVNQQVQYTTSCEVNGSRSMGWKFSLMSLLVVHSGYQEVDNQLKWNMGLLWI